MQFTNDLTHTIKTVRKRFTDGEKLSFLFFYSNKDIYSNWYPAKFTIDNIQFANSEQAMMYYKAVLFQDSRICSLLKKEKNPATCKRLGRAIEGFNESKWQNCRCKIMTKVLYNKFSQNPKLKEQLLATDDKILVEASPYDTIWGIGLDKNDNRTLNPNYWKGLNLLGFCLMEVREMLKNEEKV